MMGTVVGYHEEIINGTKYYVGENGNICKPHPNDSRISRSKLVGKRINEHNTSLKKYLMGESKK